MWAGGAREEEREGEIEGDREREREKGERERERGRERERRERDNRLRALRAAPGPTQDYRADLTIDSHSIGPWAFLYLWVLGFDGTW